jgi:hypothetical protein
MKELYFFICMFLLLTSCNFYSKTNGLFGKSITKEEAIKNGSEVYQFIANKKEFNLLDGSKITIDTVWTEISFTYENNKRIYDSSYGFLFSIPFKKSVAETFTFNFCLLDTTNRMFTNGITENLCQLCPIKIKDEMKILLEQKDTDTSKGWMNPIVTDTIIFTRILE